MKSVQAQNKARLAFKERIETSSNFDRRFIAYASDMIVSFLYKLFCKCYCCCASNSRGPACCRKKAKSLERRSLAVKRLKQEQDIQQMIVAGRLVRLLSRILMDKRRRKSINYFQRYVVDDEAINREKRKKMGSQSQVSSSMVVDKL